jgi:Mg2+/Co2+ transporter CorB
MIALLLLCVTVSVLLVVEGFFSGSEIAFLSANRAKILRGAKEKNSPAVWAKALLSRPETLFSTTVVGTTLAITSSTTIVTLFNIKHSGYGAEWITLSVGERAGVHCH